MKNAQVRSVFEEERLENWNIELQELLRIKSRDRRVRTNEVWEKIQISRVCNLRPRRI